jgi:hypothetical protein
MKMEKKQFDGYELIPVASISLGCGYDWDEMEIYYIESEKRFFWLSDRGCSCSWLWEDFPVLGSLENGFRKDAVNAIRSYMSDKSEYDQNHGIQAIGDVMSFRVP